MNMPPPNQPYIKVHEDNLGRYVSFHNADGTNSASMLMSAILNITLDEYAWRRHRFKELIGTGHKPNEAVAIIRNQSASMSWLNKPPTH